MITFLPHSDFMLSAQVLDYKRLGNQRTEALWAYKALLKGKHYKAYNHPVLRMWRGYEPALVLYYNVIVSEWVRRGYRNTMSILSYKEQFGSAEIKMPPWMDDYRVHLSHRKALLCKDYEHYRQFFHSPERPYVWTYHWPVDKKGHYDEENKVSIKVDSLCLSDTEFTSARARIAAEDSVLTAYRLS